MAKNSGSALRRVALVVSRLRAPNGLDQLDAAFSMCFAVLVAAPPRLPPIAPGVTASGG